MKYAILSVSYLTLFIEYGAGELYIKVRKGYRALLKLLSKGIGSHELTMSYGVLGAHCFLEFSFYAST